MVRVHNSQFGATEFNPGFGDGRFHPIAPHGDDDGRPTKIPTLYTASTHDGALSETVFHDVPIRGPGRYVMKEILLAQMFSTVAPRRDLQLAQLYGFGLGRLGVTRRELIDTPASRYPQTREWARALHAARENIDGLIWVSRQHDESKALVLFGDRVNRQTLAVVAAPIPLFRGHGLSHVRSASERAGITLVER